MFPRILHRYLAKRIFWGLTSDHGNEETVREVREIDERLRAPLEVEPDAGSRSSRLKLRVLGEPGAAAELLTDHPLVSGVEVHPRGHLIVSYLGNEKSIAAVARELIRGGVELIGLEPERTELERIFLDATQGELR